MIEKKEKEENKQATLLALDHLIMKPPPAFVVECDQLHSTIENGQKEQNQTESILKAAEGGHTKKTR